MTSTRKSRMGAMVPLAALLATSLIAGCHKDAADTDTSATVPSTAPAAPAAPASPGGPGGTMMNTPSTNPNGAPGDAVITAKVKSALIADKAVKASDINVDTKSEVVVLRGTQPTQAAIIAAEADAKKMQGVKSVINQLTAKP